MSKHTAKLHRWKNNRLLTSHHEFDSCHDAENFAHHQCKFDHEIVIKIYNEHGELVIKIGEREFESYA